MSRFEKLKSLFNTIKYIQISLREKATILHIQEENNTEVNSYTVCNIL